MQRWFAAKDGRKLEWKTKWKTCLYRGVKETLHIELNSSVQVVICSNSNLNPNSTSSNPTGSVPVQTGMLPV